MTDQVGPQDLDARRQLDRADADLQHPHVADWDLDVVHLVGRGPGLVFLRHAARQLGRVELADRRPVGLLGHRQIGLGLALEDQHPPVVANLHGLDDLAPAQDGVNISLGLALARHGGVEVLALALGPALDLLGEALGLGPGLDQHPLDLALRERTEDQPAEQGDVAEHERPERQGGDQEAAREGGVGQTVHPREG
ncbi:MAG TPA: hypothetical protein VHU81_10570 [Thermoanaerobaculia bacterium]|nr:hypothetical protein [Thermoanaerobaculia bacterium]